MSERDMTIAEFCDVHVACKAGRTWALVTCQTMNDVWNLAKPEWLVWVALRVGVLDDRTLRLFACWSVRQVWRLLGDVRSRHAVEVSERFAEGLATEQELIAARKEALAAVKYTSDWSVSDALALASGTASDAAWATTWRVARDAATSSHTAAHAAAWGASDRHPWQATVHEAITAQVAWLRENAKPSFVRVPAVAQESSTAEI